MRGLDFACVLKEPGTLPMDPTDAGGDARRDAGPLFAAKKDGNKTTLFFVIQSCMSYVGEVVAMAAAGSAGSCRMH